MTLDLRQWSEIGRALRVEGVAAELEEHQPGWRFRLDRSPEEWGHLLLEDGWGTFEAPLPPACTGLADSELLELSAVLPGACRIGLRQQGEPRLLLDVALDDGDTAPGLCRAGMARVMAAGSWLARARRGAPSAVSALAAATSAWGPREHGPAEPIAAATLLDWIRAAGWICEERDNGRIVIDLETRGHHQQVRADRDGAGGLAFAATIARRAELSEASLSVLARYLLRVSGRRRLVGGSLGSRDARAPEVRFEVRLAGPLDAGLVDHALAALSLTLHTCGREARAVAAGALGPHYTAMWPGDE